ncbi:hypothetical protein [Pseudomonas brassicacearum]|uniref:Uncharacterized protein n=1 Tax=Pseudomonas brassicacearum TaxID=930166 RepID=A0A423JXG1_9PSED|nr:hypothetical protein [Pseudomonas brassicacearum]RON42373.1 hypothetical protein BK664_01975 [Pseudomonas brassicacearum]
MSVHTTKDVSDSAGDAEVDRSTALFFEADRLDAFAYGILDMDAKTAEIWKKFTEAKAIADAKRAEASRILKHARCQKKR